MKDKILKLIYVVLIGAYAVSWLTVRQLPKLTKVDKEMLNGPVQTETERQDFSFAYREKDYHVKPLYDYELWGLVVSVNNINAWYNYYHDENTVNLKDVCVVWGDNIKNEVYRDKEIKFSSGEWTCYYKWSGRLKKQFYPNKLSNNHLLTANEQVQAVIRDINIGDQIHIKGALVDYAEAGTNWYRKTSISRDDVNQTSRSGGACEIVYVDEINILGKNVPYWHIIKDWSLRIFFALIILRLLMLVLAVFKKSEEQTKMG